MFNWDKDHQIIDEWNHYSPPLSYKMLFFMFSVKTLRAEHRRPPEVRLSFSSSLTLGHPQRRRWGEVALLTERWNIRCSQARLLNPLLPPFLPPAEKREDQSLPGALPPRVRHLQRSRTGRRSTRRSAARRRSLDTRGGSGVRRDWVPLTGNTLKTNPTGASDEDLILVMKVYWCWWEEEEGRTCPRNSI